MFSNRRPRVISGRKLSSRVAAITASVKAVNAVFRLSCPSRPIFSNFSAAIASSVCPCNSNACFSAKEIPPSAVIKFRRAITSKSASIFPVAAASIISARIVLKRSRSPLDGPTRPENWWIPSSSAVSPPKRRRILAPPTRIQIAGILSN